MTSSQNGNMVYCKMVTWPFNKCETWLAEQQDSIGNMTLSQEKMWNNITCLLLRLLSGSFFTEVIFFYLYDIFIKTCSKWDLRTQKDAPICHGIGGYQYWKMYGDMRDRIVLCPDGPGTHESIWPLERLKVPLDIPWHNSDKLIWCHPH